MKLFRVVPTEGDGEWWGILVLAETEVDATTDPCLSLNRPSNLNGRGKLCYQATELTTARKTDVEAAHHCPRYIWAFDDTTIGSREFLALELKRRHEHRPMAELRLPRIVGKVSNAKPRSRVRESGEQPESIAS